MELDEQSLRILSCDIDVRPRNAAGIEHLMPYLLKTEIAADALFVYFDLSGAAAVASFVEAERLCCTGLVWTLAGNDDHLQLKIDGSAEQTDLIRQWFAADPA